MKITYDTLSEAAALLVSVASRNSSRIVSIVDMWMVMEDEKAQMRTFERARDNAGKDQALICRPAKAMDVVSTARPYLGDTPSTLNPIPDQALATA